MDDPFDWFNIIIAKAGVTPAQGLFVAMVLMMGFNITGRLIPDSAVGWLGTIRKACKILGLFIQNRVLPGITVGDAALAAHGTAVRANAVANVVAEVTGVEIITAPPITDPLPIEQPELTASELAGRAALTSPENGISHESAR